MCLEDSKIANTQIGLIVVCALQYSTQKNSAILRNRNTAQKVLL